MPGMYKKTGKKADTPDPCTLVPVYIVGVGRWRATLPYWALLGRSGSWIIVVLGVLVTAQLLDCELHSDSLEEDRRALFSPILKL